MSDKTPKDKVPNHIIQSYLGVTWPIEGKMWIQITLVWTFVKMSLRCSCKEIYYAILLMYEKGTV